MKWLKKLFGKKTYEMGDQLLVAVEEDNEMYNIIIKRKNNFRTIRLDTQGMEKFQESIQLLLKKDDSNHYI
jgi:hypothetical protein